MVKTTCFVKGNRSKGEIKNTDNAKVKLDIQAGDFDAQAKMLTAGSIFKPADAPILMGEIKLNNKFRIGLLIFV